MFKVQLHEDRNLRWWYKNRGSLDFDPYYQRESNIWSKSDQMFLIDTIINDYDIPKFYLADFRSRNTPLNEDTKPYAIVDGKQRFDAIFRFFDGEISLSPKFKYQRNPSVKLNGLSYQNLVLFYPEIAQDIDSYLITVMSIITDDEGTIAEIFVRLNKGERLSGAETRNAMPGPVPVLIRALASHKFFEDNIRFDTKRGQDKNAAAKILLIEYNQELTDTKKVNLDAFAEKAEAATNPPIETSGNLFTETVTDKDFLDAYHRAMRVLDQMALLFAERDPLLSGAGSLPLFYWGIRNMPTNVEQFPIFLRDFERRRLENRHDAKSGSQLVDEELLSYDIANRSPDDRTSLDLRSNILSKRFLRFIDNNVGEGEVNTLALFHS
jgi:hypothetical protein